MNEENEFKKLFVNKKIKDIYVDGYGIELVLENGIKLQYNATDGGYSSWDVLE